MKRERFLKSGQGREWIKTNFIFSFIGGLYWEKFSFYSSKTAQSTHLWILFLKLDLPELCLIIKTRLIDASYEIKDWFKKFERRIQENIELFFPTFFQYLRNNSAHPIALSEKA
jgi:hypothetical protein